MHKSLVFIHIPKTAGTAIATVAPQIGVSIKGHDIRHPDFSHLSEYDPLSLEKYHLLAVVRNPWDRAVSSFMYLNTGGRNKGDKTDQERYVARYKGDFNAFVREAFKAEDSVIKQLHFVPQCRWICDENKNILVNTILKFENLQEEMDNFLKHQGRPVIKIPRVNTTVHKHYDTYYNNESIEIINEVYQKDIKMFGYTFHKTVKGNVPS